MAFRRGAAWETKKLRRCCTSTFSMLRQKVFLGNFLGTYRKGNLKMFRTRKWDRKWNITKIMIFGSNMGDFSPPLMAI